MFCTVLRSLKSPQNVGMIIRSHVAFGGDRVVFLGDEQPWRFGKGSQAFSRGLERRCEILTLTHDDEFFAWCHRERWEPVALEVASPPVFLDAFCFPDRTALVVGHEGKGLPAGFLARCRHVVTVPQFGAVGSLNVAVACAIALYELNRGRSPRRAIEGSKFAGERRPEAE